MMTVQYVLGAALSLLAFVVMMNFVVFVYARGAVRAAVDEGARTGGRTGATVGDCEARATAVLADLLAGALGDGVTVRCRHEDEEMHAHADVTFRGWLPAFAPDWTFDLEAQSVKDEP